MSFGKYIKRNCDHFRDREFKLVGPFNDSPIKFNCAICPLKGYKGYILKDDIGEIKVGKRCLERYFIKSSDLEDNNIYRTI